MLNLNRVKPLTARSMDSMIVASGGHGYVERIFMVMSFPCFGLLSMITLILLIANKYKSSLVLSIHLTLCTMLYGLFGIVSLAEDFEFKDAWLAFLIILLSAIFNVSLPLAQYLIQKHRSS